MLSSAPFQRDQLPQRPPGREVQAPGQAGALDPPQDPVHEGASLVRVGQKLADPAQDLFDRASRKTVSIRPT